VPSKEEIRRVQRYSFLSKKAWNKSQADNWGHLAFAKYREQLIQITGEYQELQIYEWNMEEFKLYKWDLLPVWSLRSGKSHCPSDCENLTDYEW
jgi:hypothetical protein